MLGLRKLDEIKIENYFELVQLEANKKRKIFFEDCFEGNEQEFENITAVEIRGFLINEKDMELFMPEWEIDKVTDPWYECMCWAEWSLDSDDEDDIKIQFVFYN